MKCKGFVNNIWAGFWEAKYGAHILKARVLKASKWVKVDCQWDYELVKKRVILLF